MWNDHRRTNRPVRKHQAPEPAPARRHWLGILVAVGALALVTPGSAARAAEEGGGHASGGGHDAGGGHASGGGHDSGSSHEGGGCSGGACAGGGEDRGRHGLGGGLGKQARNRGFNIDQASGRVSGERGGSDRAARHGISGSHYFGAGWLGGSRHVPAGIGGEPQSGSGEQAYAGLGGGGRGFGYWGRRTGDGDTDQPPSTNTEQPTGMISGTGGPVIRSNDTGQALSCERFASEDLAGKRRLMGKNLIRLKIAGHMIAPTYTSNAQRYAGFAERHLSYYQAEASKTRPDVLLLGTYLGLIAEKPINPGLVEQVDHTLCVALPTQDTNTIVDVAEGQRKHLKAFVSATSGR